MNESSENTNHLTSPEESQDCPVTRCRLAFQEAVREARDQNVDRYAIRGRAKTAYMAKMPFLDTPENIRDFIACVAQGILLDVFDHFDCKRLLYAAQVAVSAIRSPAGRKGKAA